MMLSNLLIKRTCGSYADWSAYRARLGVMNTMQASHRSRFGSVRTITACLMLLASVMSVRADAPLVDMWVAIKVAHCKAVTFEAPANKPGQYVPGEKYRTAKVTGQVVDAGIRLFNVSEEWRQKAAEEAKKRLPVKGAELSFVLPQWNAPFCEAAIGKVERFDYDYSCDIFLRTGPCMPPHQMVRPTSQ